jgi:hypothetical protein
MPEVALVMHAMVKDMSAWNSILRRAAAIRTRSYLGGIVTTKPANALAMIDTRSEKIGVVYALGGALSHQAPSPHSSFHSPTHEAKAVGEPSRAGSRAEHETQSTALDVLRYRLLVQDGHADPLVIPTADSSLAHLIMPRN